jgi:hypothetical protein
MLDGARRIANLKISFGCNRITGLNGKRLNERVKAQIESKIHSHFYLIAQPTVQITGSA